MLFIYIIDHFLQGFLFSLYEHGSHFYKQTEVAMLQLFDKAPSSSSSLMPSMDSDTVSRITGGFDRLCRRVEEAGGVIATDELKLKSGDRREFSDSIRACLSLTSSYY